jgi:hypothetical protein
LLNITDTTLEPGAASTAFTVGLEESTTTVRVTSGEVAPPLSTDRSTNVCGPSVSLLAW